MQTFIKKHINIILPIIAIIAFYIIMPYINNQRINERIKTSKSGVYSIATITEFRTETRSNYYKYSFDYQNKTFRSKCVCRNKSLTVGQKYFLIIDPENPNYNNFLLPIFPVPDSIIEAPPEGWKELPISVDKEEIRKFLEDY